MIVSAFEDEARLRRGRFPRRRVAKHQLWHMCSIHGISTEHRGPAAQRAQDDKRGLEKPSQLMGQDQTWLRWPQDSENVVAVFHTNAGAFLELDAECREEVTRDDAGIAVGGESLKPDTLLTYRCDAILYHNLDAARWMHAAVRWNDDTNK